MKCYVNRGKWYENGWISKEDEKILKEGTVEFIGCSYYLTTTVTSDKNMKRTGNDSAGKADVVENPYLKTSDWGWTIDPVSFTTGEMKKDMVSFM